MMKYRDIIGGLFWLGVGVLFFVWSTRYPRGSLRQPGPGFIPAALGILLVLLSLMLLGRAVKTFAIAQRQPPSSPFRNWRKVAFTVAILLIGLFVFETMGHLLTFFLLIVFLMRGTERESWKKILLVAFCSAMGVYLVFVLLLKQPLPQGWLGI